MSMKVLDKVELNVNVEIPPDYALVLWNDDENEFFSICRTIMDGASVSEADAMNITMTAHHEGKAVIGMFPYEICEAMQDSIVEAGPKYGAETIKVTIEEVDE